MTDVVAKSAEEILDIMRGRGVTVVTKADAVAERNAQRHFSKFPVHVEGECPHCHTHSKHLDSHVGSCILNPVRKNRKGMKVCKKCKLMFHLSTHKCNGDMAEVIRHHLGDLRMQYRSATGAKRVYGNHHGPAKTDFPDWFVTRSMELWHDRGMPKSWKFDKHMVLVRPADKTASPKKAEKKAKTPVVEDQTFFDIDTMNSVDMAQILFMVIGEENVADNLGTIMKWMDLTKELIG